MLAPFGSKRAHCTQGGREALLPLNETQYCTWKVTVLQSYCALYHVNRIQCAFISDAGLGYKTDKTANVRHPRSSTLLSHFTALIKLNEVCAIAQVCHCLAFAKIAPKDVRGALLCFDEITEGKYTIRHCDTPYILHFTKLHPGPKAQVVPRQHTERGPSLT